MSRAQASTHLINTDLGRSAFKGFSLMGERMLLGCKVIIIIIENLKFGCYGTYPHVFCRASLTEETSIHYPGNAGNSSRKADK